jgi:hypothetical protein
MLPSVNQPIDNGLALFLSELPSIEPGAKLVQDQQAVTILVVTLRVTVANRLEIANARLVR